LVSCYVMVGLAVALRWNSNIVFQCGDCTFNGVTPEE
jgi:hypothetical protein